jgi:D-alanine-D-alanine ligase
MKRLNVAVIFGGRSGEHEVSLVSARSIIAALDPKRYRAVPMAILKTGRWIGGQAAWKYLKGKAAAGVKGTRLPELAGVDVAFPIVHGTFGEDGTLQGLLEMAGVPYVGCGVAASAIGMDKDVQKRLLRLAGIPTAPAAVIRKDGWRRHLRPILKAALAVGFPLFVKPARSGSSVGVSKVKDAEGLGTALAAAFRYDDKVLLEKAVPRAREIECAVLGNDPYGTSGLGEIVPSGEFYDFNAKYVDGKSDCLLPAPLAKPLAKRLRAAASEICRVLGVEGLARVDFLLERGTQRWVLNEINTLPGFTSISMYPKLWRQEGMSYRSLISRLIGLALERAARQADLTTDFSSNSDWFKQS